MDLYLGTLFLFFTIKALVRMVGALSWDTKDPKPEVYYVIAFGSYAILAVWTLDYAGY